MNSKPEIEWTEVSRIWLSRRAMIPLKKLYLSGSPTATTVSSSSDDKTKVDLTTTMTLSMGRGQATAWRTTIWNWISKAGRGVFLSFAELSEIYNVFYLFLDGQNVEKTEFAFDNNRSLHFAFEDDSVSLTQKRGDVESQIELGRPEMEKVVETIPAFQLFKDLKDEPDSEHFKKIGEVFAAECTIAETQHLIEGEGIFSATTDIIAKRVMLEQVDDVKLRFENVIKALRESVGLKAAEVREIKNAGLLLLAEEADFPVLGLIRRLGEEDSSTLEKVCCTLYQKVLDGKNRREYALKRSTKDKASGKRQKPNDKD